MKWRKLLGPNADGEQAAWHMQLAQLDKEVSFAVSLFAAFRLALPSHPLRLPGCLASKRRSVSTSKLRHPPLPRSNTPLELFVSSVYPSVSARILYPSRPVCLARPFFSPIPSFPILIESSAVLDIAAWGLRREPRVSHRPRIRLGIAEAAPCIPTRAPF